MVQIPMNMFGHAIEPEEDVTLGDASDGLAVRRRLDMVATDDVGCHPEEPRLETHECHGGLLAMQVRPGHHLFVCVNVCVMRLCLNVFLRFEERTYHPDAEVISCILENHKSSTTILLLRLLLLL